MHEEALAWAAVAVIVDFPLTVYLEKYPETGTLMRLLLIGSVAYFGVRAAGAFLGDEEWED